MARRSRAFRRVVAVFLGFAVAMAGSPSGTVAAENGSSATTRSKPTEYIASVKWANRTVARLRQRVRKQRSSVYNANRGVVRVDVSEASVREGLSGQGLILRFRSPSAYFQGRRVLLDQDVSGFARVKLEVPELQTLVIDGDPGHAREIANALRSMRGLTAIVPNPVVPLQGFQVNDPRYIDQWYLPAVKVPGAWSLAPRMGQDVVIGIVDTGIDRAHEDLAGNVRSGYDVLFGSHETTDVDGHGTMVAGVAAAITGNGRGIAGVAGRASVLPIRVTKSDRIDVATGIAGILEAAKRGARVINLSWGSSEALPEDLQYLLFGAVYTAMNEHDAVVVAAAGNEGLPRLSTPANIPGVVAVAATDRTGRRASFSNYSDPAVEPFVTAPGVDVLTTVPMALESSGYIRASGTSFAAPIVSGVAALMRSAYPDYTAWQVFYMLLATADDRGAAGPDNEFGMGVINGQRALDPKSHLALLDAYEGNDRPEFAKKFPLGRCIEARVNPVEDLDWYRWQLYFKAPVKVSYSLPADLRAQVRVEKASGTGDVLVQLHPSRKTVTRELPPGQYRVLVQGADPEQASLELYRLCAKVVVKLRDIARHWAKDSIQSLADAGVIRGYPGGEFRSEALMTRAEFVTVVNQAAGLQPLSYLGGFRDVKKGDWFAAHVAAATKAGYIKGYKDGTFRPNQPITRNEMSVVLAKVLKLSPGGSLSFKDKKLIPSWAAPSVAALVQKGYVSGYPDKTFRGSGRATRAEIATVVNRACLRDQMCGEN